MLVDVDEQQLLRQRVRARDRQAREHRGEALARRHVDELACARARARARTSRRWRARDARARRERERGGGGGGDVTRRAARRCTSARARRRQPAARALHLAVAYHGTTTVDSTEHSSYAPSAIAAFHLSRAYASSACGVEALQEEQHRELLEARARGVGGRGRGGRGERAARGIGARARAQMGRVVVHHEDDVLVRLPPRRAASGSGRPTERLPAQARLLGRAPVEEVGVQSAGPAPSISAAMASAISSSPGAYRIVCVNAWPAKPRMRPRARSTMSSDAGSMAASLKFSRIFLFGAQAAG